MFLRYLEHPPVVAISDPGSTPVLLHQLRMDPDHDDSAGLYHTFLRRQLQPIIDLITVGTFTGSPLHLVSRDQVHPVMSIR